MKPMTAISGPEDAREPTWDVALLFPARGTWSEDDYLTLNSNRLVEFSDGSLEVLPIPTTSHQRIVAQLFQLLFAFTAARRLGTVLFAPLRVRLWPGKFREPDVVFMSADHADRVGEQFWDGADLVMEVVSDDDRRRDLETKRLEYAAAGIPEYWIVDPQELRITVLRLELGAYMVHGVFASGDIATSHLLNGFTAEMAGVFGS